MLPSLSAASRPKIHRRPPSFLSRLLKLPYRVGRPLLFNELGVLRAGALGMVGMAAVSFSSLNLASEQALHYILSEMVTPVQEQPAAALEVDAVIRLEDPSGGRIVGQFMKISPSGDMILQPQAALESRASQ